MILIFMLQKVTEHRNMMILVEKGGITHLEDLAINDFLNAVKFGHQMVVTEKLDGANLAFGFDEHGEFFTSREAKGGKRFYSVEDYGSKFWEVGFKAAHLALEKVAPKIKQSGAMGAGDVVNCEILFGALPNTVSYSGDTNQIVFLHPLQGNPNIESLQKLLDGKTVTVALKDVPHTEDGKTIVYTTQSYTWRFVKVPSVNPKIVSKAFAEKDLAYKINELETILNKPSGFLNFSNLEIMSLPLNKRPESVDKTKWQMVVAEIKKRREQLKNEINDLKLDIKDKLLDNLVRNVSSAFGPDIHKGGWIEGLVFRDSKTGKMFKLVDKNLFTLFNKFNWKIRELLSASGGKKLKSLLGKMYLRMATAIGHPKLVQPFGERYVQNLGNSTEEILKNLSANVNLQEVKSKWLNELNKAEKIAQRIFDWYEKNKNKLKKTVKMGSKTYEMSYEGAVDQKTKQTFASLFAEIAQMKKMVQDAKTSEQLVSLLIKPDHLILDQR